MGMPNRFLDRHSGLSPISLGSPRLIAYLGISGFLALPVSMLILLPSFLQQQGWSSQRIGWAMGSYSLVYIVACIVAGPIADRYRNVPTALVGVAIGCAGGLLYIGALWSPQLVFAARVCDAVGAGMVTTAVLILLVNSVPEHLRGRVIGYFGLPGFVFLGLGPLLSEWLIHTWGFEGTFGCVVVIFVVIGAILLRLPRPLAPRGVRRPFFEGLRVTVQRLRLIMAFMVVFGFCFSTWTSFLALAVSSLGVGAVSSFGLGYGSGALASRLALSHRLDSGFWRLVGISTMTIYGVGLILIPHSTQLWHLLVLGLACGMCHGVYYPSLSSMASERFHPLHVGQAVGLYYSVASLGFFLGPPLWGALADVTSYQTSFAWAGILMILATVFFVLVQWRHMGRLTVPLKLPCFKNE